MQNGKHSIARDLVDGVGFGTTEFHVLRASGAIIAEWIHFFLRQPRILDEAEAAFTGSAGQQRVPESFLTSLKIPLPPLPDQRWIVAVLQKQIEMVADARRAVEAQLEAAHALPAAFLSQVLPQPGQTLPTGWRWMKIADLAKTCSGTTPSRGNAEFYGGVIPWVKTSELKDNTIIDTEEHVTPEALEKTSLRLLPRRSLLVPMYGQGQTRGRTGLLACEATTNQACFAILPNPNFEPPFIQFWFRHSYARLRQMTEGRGGNQPNLNGDVLRQEFVPLPPLPEQRRIAGMLQEQMEAVTDAQRALEARITAIENLPAAFLRQVFSVGSPDAPGQVL